MLEKAYGESTLLKTLAYEWYSAFKSGWDVLEDLPRSGRPATSSTEVNIAEVREMVTENRHLSLREIAAEPFFFKRLLGHETRCCSTSSERPEFSSKTQSREGQKLNEYHGKTTVSTWYGFGRHSFLSKTQITTSRHLFLVDRRHKREFAARTEVDSGKCVKNMFCWLDYSLAEVYYFRWGLLSRR